MLGLHGQGVRALTMTPNTDAVLGIGQFANTDTVLGLHGPGVRARTITPNTDTVLGLHGQGARALTISQFFRLK